MNRIIDINVNELITFYPEKLPSSIQNIQKQVQEQDLKIKIIQSEDARQMKEMDNILCRLLWAQLQSLGLFTEKNLVIGELNSKNGMFDRYGRWLKESILILARNNYLQCVGETCFVNDMVSVDVDAIWKEWDRKKSVWLEDPNMKAQVILVERTLQALSEILTGKVLATDIVFPNSSMELVEGIYKDNIVADYFNEVLADTVVSYINEQLRQDSSAQIRILEIGAGTGGTSCLVFKKLKSYQEHIKEYCYTDISKAFLMHGEKEYGSQNPYLTYKIFDLGAPIAGQGISAGGYDIVIAANVLHATKNIRQTLRNAKATLKKHGLILLNEISGNTLFTHLTFGLLDGWWLYEDTALRIPGCPGLSPETWQTVLESEGFRSVFFPAQGVHALGQQIVVAESDGAVRQKQQTSPRVTPTKNKVIGKILKKSPKESCPKTRPEGITQDLLQEKSKAYFKKMIGETLKIPINKIDSSEPLENYGIDSILVVRLANTLRKTLANISTTLFFEYQTIDALVNHFIDTQRDSLMVLVGLENQELDKDISVNDEILIEPLTAYPNQKFRKSGRFIQQQDSETKKSISQPSIVQDIAIIGLAGRYSQARNIQEFWENLKSGKNCIQEIPKDRWHWEKYFDEEKGKKGSIYTKWGGFIEDIDKFDPLFFQISPAEAEQMDPQERLFLEVAYTSIEDAGYTPVNLCDSRKVGVFVGVMNGNYPTGSSYWSIANRISYLLNFQGPSMAVDTACSSSLTAIHLALESLYSGMSECAIAGGVNLIVDSVHYMKLTSKAMLSSGDQCKSFGEQADGFVDGEGVGAIVLKPLQKAIADGDHIYGIIKGSMLNAGGKTNGYTVPNPSAQFQLIFEALKRAKVHARTISYIEAHGTGTALGDPIEISGLMRAFEQDTKDKQFCAIGSAKSNIGHCESAAGIAGLTKVLLQLKHRKLVPSLHSKVLNPNIDFSNTPFVVQQELADWKRPFVEINGETREYPRIAGISAFGAGGSNANVVIEEYIPQDSEQLPIAIIPQTPAIIVLSAKSENKLQEQVQQLLGAIQEQQFTDSNLADIAYTLQVGREAMEERLSVIAGSIKELEEKLKSFLKEQDGIEDLYRGQVKRNKETMAIFAADEDMTKTIDAWISKAKYAKLLDLWVKGLVFDWNKLYSDTKPRRISLPTYPFTRERYWVPEIKMKSDATTSPATTALIHPLLHQNTSDFSEQRFSSSFTGQEFFLADHVVKGQRVLPGVTYLEMARVAVEKAAGVILEETTTIRLKNVVWARPIAVGDQPVKIHIGLFPGDNTEIAYEIYSESEVVDTETVMHSQGSAVLSAISISKVPSLDIRAIQAQCNQYTLTSRQCYDAFLSMGLEYGPAHQGIETMYVGSGQVLAKLSLPSSVSNNQNQFVLHPSLMDAALQASIGLMMDAGDLKLALPYALQELEILGKCTSVMWALVQYSNGSTGEDKVQKFDIDLCDEQGNVCVRMIGLSSRVLEGEVIPVGTTTTLGTLMIHPSWEEQSLAQDALDPDYAHHLVILCEPNEITQKDIVTSMNGVRCLILQSQQTGIEERFQTYAVQVFEEVQSVLKEKPLGKILIQIVVPTQEEGQLFSGISGLLKTAQLENPKLFGQQIEVDTRKDSERIIEILKENSLHPFDRHVRYQDGKRYVAVWSEVKSFQGEVSLPWKDQGIYLITGGVGGLGLIFASEIVYKVKDVTLVLTGRSPLNKEKQARLKELEALGARIEYRQVDVTHKKAVDDLIQSIREDFGSLNGIIHSAGVIRDNFILKKTKEELQEVLASKVNGLVNLDQTTEDLLLDFFILFSSAAGAFGNVGQADYAAANAFMDVYSKYRNGLVASKQRHGQTLSINWPLWKDGGMRVDAEIENMMKQSIGMIAMQTSTGIRALYQGLASGKDQVIVLEGDLKRLQRALLGQSFGTEVLKVTASVAENKAMSGIAQDVLQEKAINYFKSLLSSVIGLPVQRIEADAPMEEYGIDSIMVMKLTNQLEKIFGSLSKTLFFEYQNIQELTIFFLTSYRDQITKLMGVEEEKTEVTAKNFRNYEIPIEPMKPVFGNRRRPRFIPPSIESRKEKGALDIAIIGVSGRYPQARNIQEFWNNLRDAKDCITEIPKDRWDHSLYFDKDKNKPGKTNSKWGGFLEGVDQFDPLFFNISPREAEIMDPQERLFLECVFETLEDAGYTRDTLKLYQDYGLEGNVGVYVGVMYEEYQLYGVQEQIQGRPIALSGNASTIANRVSYFCNFHGPSMAVDTMCSSSLTAIHLACQSLQSGECELAIAGGVNVSIHPNKYLMLGQGKFASSKGRCESFGQGGDGYVPGEGVGAVLLKPLSKAVAEGDNIYGVIKATSINHGGKTNGYTVPNPNAQASVIRRALKEAEIEPRTISYIEAHGTGTSLGDPIEIAGLNKVFQEYTKDTQFCAVGSAKSNIGHCESAAGIAGLTKVLLQLKHRKLVPSLHSKVLNPNIDFSNTPFVVQQELAEWKRPVVEINGEIREYPRIAAISTFGAGGSNAHMVVEEFVPKVQQPPPIMISARNPAIIVLSARKGDQLRERVQQLLAVIQEQQFSDLDLADMAYTLQVGREAMEERLAVIVDSTQKLEEKLKCFIEGLDGIEDLYLGQVVRNKENLDIFTADEDMVKAVDAWISKGKYAKLLELWVKGLTIDWQKLYVNNRPCRISLPTYPFVSERYWGSKSGSKSCDTPIESLITRHSVEPRKVTEPRKVIEPNFSDISIKPNGVSLRSLSDVQIVSTNLISQTQQSTQLSMTNISISQHEDQAESQKMSYFQTAITPELLQEGLATSLAQALYMKRNDIDLDTQFIDMGLDSITGVEWIQAINNQYETTVLATKIYDYPTIRKLAGFLEKELSELVQLKLNIGASVGDSTPTEVEIGTPTYRSGCLGIDKQVNNIPSNSIMGNLSQSSSKFSLHSIELSPLVSITDHNHLTPEPTGTQMQVNTVQSHIPVESFQEELITSLALVLYLKRNDVDVNKKFIDMGLDSITGIEWIQGINDQYGTSIPATKIYDYPTIRDFAGFLENELNKYGRELNQALNTTTPASLDEVLRQVCQGTLDIKAADQIIRHTSCYSSGNLGGDVDRNT